MRRNKQYWHTALISGTLVFLLSVFIFMCVGVATQVHADSVQRAAEAQQARLERQKELQQQELARKKAAEQERKDREKKAAEQKADSGENAEKNSEESFSAENIRAQVAALESQQGVSISVSWADGGQIHTAGSLTDFPAWSTSKVPLALALYKNGLAQGQESNISSAIRFSDNGAAEAMWATLAPDDGQRASLMTQIFRDVGDSATTVPSTHLYPGYTIFGQTSWSTSAQVSFLMNFDSLPGSAQVKNHMTNYAGNQAWGIGRYSGSALKGGWGPTRWGGYTARQLGWFAKNGQQKPIAIAAQAGSFGGATAVVDQVAQMFQ